MKKICTLILMFILLSVQSAFAAEQDVYFDLNAYITDISVDTENPDAEPSAMIDGHLDSPWRSKPNSGFPQTVTLDFGDRRANVGKVAISCVNAADEGVKNIDLDYMDAQGDWQPLRRNITLSPKSDKNSGMMEVLKTENRPVSTGAVRIRVNDAQTKDGSFNISEITVYGNDIVYPEGQAEILRFDAACGDIITLPDTVVWKAGTQFVDAPVQWRQKTLFCREPGTLKIIGKLGKTETAEAVVNISEKSSLPHMEGHWGRQCAEHLRLWGIYEEGNADPQPEQAAKQKDIVGWFYRGLGISHEYLPERVDLTKDSILPQTQATEPNELAALGIWDMQLPFAEEKNMTRMELAELCFRALRFETDNAALAKETPAFQDVSDDEREILAVLVKSGVVSDGESFRGGDIVTNAETLTMLDRLIAAAASVKVYPMPEDESVVEMPDYTVKVNGQEAGTYLAHAFPGAGGIMEKTVSGRPATEVGVSYFDFFGSAEVEITVNHTELGDASNTVIRPLSLGIRPTIEGSTIKFTLYQPCNISIEPWGTQRPLQLFANPLEKNKPDFSAENVRYYGPGVHYIDPVQIQDNETIYVDGGAVVYTKPQEEYTDGGVYYGYNIKSIEPTFSARRDNTGSDDKIKNVTIRGRGVISGSHSFDALQRHQLLRIYGCKNARVDGVVLLEGSAWNVFVAQSDGVYINNIKIVGYYANNDGIDFCDSNNGIVENCYANNADDSFLIKSWYSVDNVHFRNCSVWNTVSTSFGAVCEVIQPITNVSYTDCTVLHSTNPSWTEISGGVIGIWNNGAADIDGMRFENIVIEDAMAGKEPVKINVYPTMAEGPKEFAEVKNILFKNITILDSRDTSFALITPYKDGIHDVVFENFIVNGEKVNELDERFTLQNAVDIQVKP